MAMKWLICLALSTAMPVLAAPPSAAPVVPEPPLAPELRAQVQKLAKDAVKILDECYTNDGSRNPHEQPRWCRKLVPALVHAVQKTPALAAHIYARAYLGSLLSGRLEDDVDTEDWRPGSRWLMIEALRTTMDSHVFLHHVVFALQSVGPRPDGSLDDRIQVDELTRIAFEICGVPVAMPPPWLREFTPEIGRAWATWWLAHGQDAPAVWQKSAREMVLRDLKSSDLARRYQAMNQILGLAPVESTAELRTRALWALREVLLGAEVPEGVADAHQNLVDSHRVGVRELVFPPDLDGHQPPALPTSGSPRAKVAAAPLATAPVSALRASVQVQSQLAQCLELVAKFQPKQAVRVCERAAREEADTSAALVARAWAMLDAAEPGAAVEAARQAVDSARYPDKAQAQLVLAAAYTVSRRREEARRTLDALVADAAVGAQARDRVALLQEAAPSPEFFDAVVPPWLCMVKIPTRGEAYLKRRGWVQGGTAFARFVAQSAPATRAGWTAKAPRKCGG
jgi:hypothetical protein